MTCSTYTSALPDLAGEIWMTQTSRLRTVQSGGAVVSGDPGAEITSLGLGSCLSFVAYDPLRGVGGMAHCLLPDSSEGWHAGGDAGWYVDTALPGLLTEMQRLGTEPEQLEMAIVGGARVMDDSITGSASEIGSRNVAAARATMERHGLLLRAAWTGGRRGRSVRLFVRNGRVEIKTARGPTVVLMGTAGGRAR